VFILISSNILPNSNVIKNCTFLSENGKQFAYFKKNTETVIFWVMTLVSINVPENPDISLFRIHLLLEDGFKI
jgi:hypothetical protein